MKRIECSDVTETLMKAMEIAGDMESIIIIYQNKLQDDVRVGGFLENETMTIERANWLADMYKQHLMSCIREHEGDDD